MLPLDHPDRATVGGCGAGWWWHSPADTLDKADADILASDVALYLTIVSRITTPAVLPFNFVAVADDYATLLRGLHEAAAGSLRLLDLAERADRLRALAERLEEARTRLAATTKSRPPRGKAAAHIARLNRGLMALSRLLNPPLYTVEGPYDHDPALQAPMLPGLQAVKRLATLPPTSGEYGFLRTRLVRERNRVADALDAACDHIEILLAEIGEGAKS
jgi:hypothetical protein